MCGLFGMMGPGINHEDLSFIKDLAYVSGLRGLDGTGICQGTSYHNRKKFIIEKSAHDVPHFLWFHRWAKDGNSKILNQVSDNFIIGHVRAATIGAINNENSHPFEFKNLVGFHNGTLLDKKYNRDKSKTDSELLFEDIDKNGIIPVLKELNKDSAYAIVIFDKVTGEIHFINNGKRPLVWACNKERNVFYWASEPAMIHLCALRRGIKIEKPFVFNPYVLYTIKPTHVSKSELSWRREQFTPDFKQEIKVEEPMGNVLPFLPPYSKTRRRKFRTNCTICRKEMTLVDQYYGRESAVQPGGYVCSSCNKKIAKKV